MGALVIDALSAKTLPALDSMFRKSGGTDVVTDIIMKTDGEPLLRLVLAALSRHRYFAFEESDGNEKLLEMLIDYNFKGGDPEKVREGIVVVLERAGVNVQRILLAQSIARFNIYDNHALGMER